MQGIIAINHFVLLLLLLLLFLCVVIVQTSKARPIARTKRNTLTALWRAFGTQILQGVSLGFVSDVLLFGRPILVQWIISLSSQSIVSSSEVAREGIFYGTVIAVLSCIHALVSSTYFYHMANIGVRVQTALMSSVYR